MRFQFDPDLETIGLGENWLASPGIFALRLSFSLQGVGRGMGEGRNWRVVLVDHAAELRCLLAELLSAEQEFVVEQAGDGQAGLRLVAEKQPDLVLMEWAMPDVHGQAAVPEMRRSSPASAIVVLSEPGPPDLERRALRAGADGFRLKNPHLIHTLVDDMKGLLAGRPGADRP